MKTNAKTGKMSGIVLIGLVVAGISILTITIYHIISSQSTSTTSQPEVVRTDHVITEQAAKAIDIQTIEQAVKDFNINIHRIKNWVEALDSNNVSIRTSAINSLKNEIGLDFGYDPQSDGKKLNIASKRWKEYVENLKISINTKIPKLMEERTSRNKNHRAWAAMFLGESAPHPAFLPVLRAVIANNSEYCYARSKALAALSQIPHDGMIEFLIECLHPGPTELKMKAWEQLRKLTRAPIYCTGGKGGSWHTANWEGVKTKYKKWWQDNKPTYVYERNRVMFEQ